MALTIVNNLEHISFLHTGDHDETWSCYHRHFRVGHEISRIRIRRRYGNSQNSGSHAGEKNLAYSTGLANTWVSLCKFGVIPVSCGRRLGMDASRGLSECMRRGVGLSPSDPRQAGTPMYTQAHELVLSNLCPYKIANELKIGVEGPVPYTITVEVKLEKLAHLGQLELIAQGYVYAWLSHPTCDCPPSPFKATFS
ncbi:hypothetical protein VNO77_19455 [Canavalia gladiata]|uniref:Uncharacterized protein n=1 Tax=Canavalia gladiata TaxID=3824 RepID=A0AAN9QPM3_CANGL